MAKNIMWEKETFGFLATFTEEDGTPFDLTGATIASRAKGPGGAVVTLTTVLVDEAAGQLRSTAPSETFTSGNWVYQAEAIVAGVLRVIEDSFFVKESIG